MEGIHSSQFLRLRNLKNTIFNNILNEYSLRASKV